MNRPPSHLAGFAAQIAEWAATECARGQLPFRRLEANLELLTDRGRQTAPLIFWINRNSLLAGGLLFFPRRDQTEGLQQPAALARALGLISFACWEPDRICIYPADSEAPGRSIWQLPGESDPASFQAGLSCLLQDFKQAAVTNALPPQQLSAAALANLCLLAYRDLRDQLKGSLPDSFPLDTKALLTLNRLLFVQYHELLPPGVYPEGLEKALRLALHQLPSSLCWLALPSTEPALPQTAAVRLHHLWYRLQQTALAGDGERMANLCDLLLEEFTPPLLPPPYSGHQICSINLPGLKSTDLELEVADAELLGLAALIRECRGTAHPRQQAGIWHARPLQPGPNLLFQADTKSPPLSRTERQQRATLLRASWPQRRFNLPSRTPAWLWDLCHLLGQLPSPGRCRAVIPGNLLSSPGTEQLWELIKGDFGLASIARPDHERLELDLRSGGKTHEIELQTPTGGRSLPWAEVRNWPLSWLLLALDGWWPLAAGLPEKSWRMTSSEDWDETLRPAMELFFRLGPGATILQRLGLAPQKSLSTNQLKKISLAYRLPIPPSRALEGIQRQLDLDPSETMTEERLQEFFGDFRATTDDTPPSVRAASGTGVRTSPRRLTELADQLFAPGIPDFPEQYLYHLTNEQLRPIDLPGPLQLGERFFDLVGLRHNETEVMTTSPAEAGCLLIALHDGSRQLRLPTTPDACRDLLQRYLADLEQLQQTAEQLARAETDNPAQAKRLAQRLWQTRPLPAADLINQALQLL